MDALILPLSLHPSFPTSPTLFYLCHRTHLQFFLTSITSLLPCCSHQASLLCFLVPSFLSFSLHPCVLSSLLHLLPPSLWLVSMAAGTEGRSDSYYYLNDVTSAGRIAACARGDRMCVRVCGTNVFCWYVRVIMCVCAVSLFIDQQRPRRTVLSHTHTHTLKYTHTHTLTHTLKHTHTHTQTHTHSNTHSFSLCSKIINGGM